MPSGQWTAVLRSTIDQMGTSFDSFGPLPLHSTLLQAFRLRGHTTDGPEDAERLAAALLSDDPNDVLHRYWGEVIRAWDHIDEASWTQATPRHSRQRRDLIYSLLATSREWNNRCEALHPPRLAGFQTTVVIGAAWTPWYLPERRLRAFYWPRYRDHLLRSGWPAASVQDLDRDSTKIVERLGDPEAATATAVRGLVVGYVQSGKTANFTAVVAKAADAGYRLIIVLAGTLNVLRNQTQRRLDMELVGRELIQSHPNDDGIHDYATDAEWLSFVSHGDLPSSLGSFNWERLTTARFDFKSLKAGIDALEFRHAVPGRRYNDPANLHRDAARLLVVKKTPTILRRIARDLKRLRTALATVPALIIDDESDLASVNTLPPRRNAIEEQKRTQTNARIVELLDLLPRSAYVGYTATPAATVLMNEREELFPRDFIIPLPRPHGYMGAAEFFDPPGLSNDARYREKSFVIKVEHNDEAPANLPAAVDCFVLTGCIKLFRELSNAGAFRHHTMLVHRSHQLSLQERDRTLLKSLFAANRFTTATDLDRVRAAYRRYFLEAASRFESAGRRDLVGPLPAEGDLRQLCDVFFGEKVHPDGVLVVNGDPRYRELAPDFDLRSIWAVIVGGTKLSRGYTVEGLTISYYRRKVASADTLMQMGRWFGFRRGYQDLVRVFIGVENRPNKPPLDLHEEFRACCMDEEEFRSELIQYASEGASPLRPIDVPPLVYSSGALLPTSSNKMFHARQAVANFGGKTIERTMAPRAEADIVANWDAFETMLSPACLRNASLSLGPVQFSALVGERDPASVLRFLRSYRWSREGSFDPVLRFLEGSKGSPEIEGWIVLMPHRVHQAAGDSYTVNGHQIGVRHRARIGDGAHRYKVFSEPAHVVISTYLAGVGDLSLLPNDEVGRLRRPQCAVLVAYACRDHGEPRVNLGFFVSFPSNRLPWKASFVTVQTQP